ncbi:beta-2-microglobulin-like [Paramormyrops kingsleyae]|uniref:Beta-2-microglobulin n=1 Tax=Paramormyrops kingsleyae TaxID=1676925 RepID=A0A3B3QH60_9TELE|nr:beta-2-microglobulin-like [Paramormyrops kingsleyae]XP_023681936.1 beta-2-microglobulin-like [Paramormyrops kingsleyae]
MKIYLSVAVISLVFFSVNAKDSPPKVQVYTHIPGDYGVPNTLICHVTGFHPPDIVITLLEDGREMANAKQTDLAFEDRWQFYLTKSVPFTPVKGKTYACRVNHRDKANEHYWDPDM